MKTIYLREKKSGNYEFSNRENHTHKFKTQKEFREWYHKEGIYDRKNYESYAEYSKAYDSLKNSAKRGLLIKATYRMSQTYFYSNEFKDVIKFIKKHNLF